MYRTTFVRDIVLNKHDNTMKTVDDRHSLSDPLTFPLLFPTGEMGWRPNILRQRYPECTYAHMLPMSYQVI